MSVNFNNLELAPFFFKNAINLAEMRNVLLFLAFLLSFEGRAEVLPLDFIGAEEEFYNTLLVEQLSSATYTAVRVEKITVYSHAGMDLMEEHHWYFDETLAFKILYRRPYYLVEAPDGADPKYIFAHKPNLTSVGTYYSPGFNVYHVQDPYYATLFLSRYLLGGKNGSKSNLFKKNVEVLSAHIAQTQNTQLAWSADPIRMSSTSLRSFKNRLHLQLGRTEYTAPNEALEAAFPEVAPLHISGLRVTWRPEKAEYFTAGNEPDLSLAHLLIDLDIASESIIFSEDVMTPNREKILRIADLPVSFKGGSTSSYFKLNIREGKRALEYFHTISDLPMGSDAFNRHLSDFRPWYGKWLSSYYKSLGLKDYLLVDGLSPEVSIEINNCEIRLE